MTTTGLQLYCHLCRCNKRRPNMRCIVIDASRGERCHKVYCDGCVEKRYVFCIPSLQTFFDYDRAGIRS